MAKRKLSSTELKDFLDEKADLYNRPDFIPLDPLGIPHRFSKKEDVEIAGFLSATIAWGNRKSIVANANKMMELMQESPHDFVVSHSPKELKSLEAFVHRTFNGHDFVFFIKALRNVYEKRGGLEAVFSEGFEAGDAQYAISFFKEKFFEIPHEARHRKHVSDPMQGSSAKRINMYLRWMVRSDNRGVDLGIWKSIPTSKLSIPLDVHTGNVSRKLGLLKREASDWKAVAELDKSLRKMDAVDPVRYDFALFGLGAIEKF
jgi:uncharacterized protein (TIGR02757 family)